MYIFLQFYRIEKEKGQGGGGGTSFTRILGALPNLKVN